MADSGVQNALQVQGGLNGLKTIIGVALIVLAHQIATVHDLMPLYPNASILNSALNLLNSATGALQSVTNVLGNGFLATGVVHKVLKFFIPSL